jgi:hypothetical protein
MMLVFRSFNALVAGAVLNLMLLILPLIFPFGLTEQIDLQLPSAFQPVSGHSLSGTIQRFTDWRGGDWFRLSSASPTSTPSVIRLNAAAFPEGCLIEWFSPERNALRVCTGGDETNALPFCGALKSPNMQIIQRGAFPPDQLSRGLTLGVYSLPSAGVFFRVTPAPVTTALPFRPVAASGRTLWQGGVWLTSLWVIACLISRYTGTGHKRFALLALVYAFLLGALFFERPFDGMAGSIDHDDDSYYTAYTQNLIHHKNLFAAPTKLKVGRPVIDHPHGLPGTALFLAPAAWLHQVWERRPFTSPIDLPALRWMRLASATFSLLATILLFLAAHQIAVSGWNVPVAVFLIWGTSLSKWTYQRCIFTHSIELMLLCGLLFFALLIQHRRSWIGLLAGVLLGLLCLVRGEYLLAIPILPFLFRFECGQPRRTRVLFFISFLLAVIPFVLFYRYAVGQLTTGYGSLADSTLAPHSIQGWLAPAFWQALGQNLRLLLLSYGESGVILFGGVIALLIPSTGAFYALKQRKMKIYHGGTETPSSLRQGSVDHRRKSKCGVYFVHAGTRDQNKRHGFLDDILSVSPCLRGKSFTFCCRSCIRTKEVICAPSAPGAPRGLPKGATALFLVAFLLATAFYPLPLGSEWQHRYSLKLYPFALLAILAWRAGTRTPRVADLVLTGAFLFSLIRQLASFAINQREIAGTGLDTAKWILSDVQVFTLGLRDAHYATLHWALALVVAGWLIVAGYDRPRLLLNRWRAMAGVAAGLLILGTLLWRAPFWWSENGLDVTYFRGQDFQHPVCRRWEPRLSKDYGFEIPALGVGRRQFSARWQGVLRVPESGTYTFFMESGGGVRLRLGDAWLIDNWENNGWRGSGRKVTLPLQAGVYPLLVEHGVRTGQGALRLRWDGGPIPDGTIVGAPYVSRHKEGLHH